MTKEELIRKYNIQVPRYTSYPTLPYWDENAPDNENWQQAVRNVFLKSNSTKGIGLYIHLPYCEKLCHYCACMRVIPENHKVEKSYIRALLREWKIYLTFFNEKVVLKELHLGGGTPTFFSPENLHHLVGSILKTVTISDNNDFSFEAHPNNTTEKHLRTLYTLGFKRVSFGIQDFSPSVQRAMNRIQPYDKVKEVVDIAREVGYNSVNCDLIYGLPKQTKSAVDYTFSYVKNLMPDRIAFYSYAHVPWISEMQRIFSDEDIPTDMEKRKLYEKGKNHLQQLGYSDIGMDHFALPHDKLYHSYKNKFLHRNFMGYNTSTTDLSIGLGVSAISDAKTAYAQNTKSVEEYEQAMQKGELQHIRSYFLSEEDAVLKRAIIDISCKRELEWNEALEVIIPEKSKEKLQQMAREKIIRFTKTGFTVTDFGTIFLRNICSVFDMKLQKSKMDKPMYSKSI